MTAGTWPGRAAVSGRHRLQSPPRPRPALRDPSASTPARTSLAVAAAAVVVALAVAALLLAATVGPIPGGGSW